MAQRQIIVPLRGGLDIVTPAIEVQPGRVVAAQNYESELRGYARVEGYERYDGQPSPSEAVVSQIAFTGGIFEPSVGDRVDGATSGAHGFLLEAPTVTSGAWGAGAAGTMLLRHVSGSFTDAEDLEVAIPFATADGSDTTIWATDDATAETKRLAAVTQARGEIAALPGSGPVRGIFTLAGEVYAVRDNAGATAGVLHKATSTGWSAQALGEELAFSAATAQFLEGETVTGGTSGATATIKRAVLSSGTWTSAGAGYLVLSGVTGTFQAAETITSTSGSATAGGASTAVALPPAGKYRTVEHNFFAGATTERIYGVNGVGYAFEWDGSTLVPIKTGTAQSLDKPTHVAVQANHLFLGYAGGSIQFSGIGNPLSFDVNAGAGEIGYGEEITGMRGKIRGSLIVTGDEKVSYITGTSSLDFTLLDVSEDSGAVADSLEVVGQPYYLDKRGVRSMETTEAFGNWNIGTATRSIEPLFDEKRRGNVYPVGVLRVRRKDQYRLVFEDGSIVSIYFGRDRPESMPLQVGFTPNIAYSGKNAAGDEILFMGDDAGFVYQMDKGTSADGAAIEAYLATSYLHQGAPNTVKRYHRLLLEMIGGGIQTAEVDVGANFSYGSDESPEAIARAVSIQGGGGLWDIALWDTFLWDAPVRSTPTAELNGIGENVSVVFRSNVADVPIHVLSSMTVNYTMRRQRR